jgi:hypothetical protein
VARLVQGERFLQLMRSNVYLIGLFHQRGFRARPMSQVSTYFHLSKKNKTSGTQITSVEHGPIKTQVKSSPRDPKVRLSEGPIKAAQAVRLLQRT